MLVTVVVVTYNSSRFVIETLESVYRQSYTDIELIVSDDRSKDNTFSLCQEWIKSHHNRFVNATAIQTPVNKGICGNYNYALNHASGEWIKYIAGDDILEDNCIERFVSNLSPRTFLYTCTAEHLNNDTNKTESYSTRIPSTTAWRQARFMLKYLYGINGPTIFVEREHLIQLGGFEEKYPMIEDWPIAIRFTVNGYRIGIVNEPLVKWRIYGESISHSNNTFAKSLRDAWYDYAMRYCWRYLLPLHHYHHWLNHWLQDNSEGSKKIRILGYCLRSIDIVNAKRKIFPLPKEPYVRVKQ